MRLQNKTALITGASRNIGAEVARTFAREGADLILNTRQSAGELEAVAAQCRELGVRTHTVIGDVSDPDWLPIWLPRALTRWAAWMFW